MEWSEEQEAAAQAKVQEQSMQLVPQDQQGTTDYIMKILPFIYDKPINTIYIYLTEQNHIYSYQRIFFTKLKDKHETIWEGGKDISISIKYLNLKKSLLLVPVKSLGQISE